MDSDELTDNVTMTITFVSVIFQAPALHWAMNRNPQSPSQWHNEDTETSVTFTVVTRL